MNKDKIFSELEKGLEISYRAASTGVVYPVDKELETIKAAVEEQREYLINLIDRLWNDYLDYDRCVGTYGISVYIGKEITTMMDEYQKKMKSEKNDE